MVTYIHSAWISAEREGGCAVVSWIGSQLLFLLAEFGFQLLLLLLPCVFRKPLNLSQALDPAAQQHGSRACCSPPPPRARLISRTANSMSYSTDDSAPKQKQPQCTYGLDYASQTKQQGVV